MGSSVTGPSVASLSESKLRRAAALCAIRSFRRAILCLAAMASAAYGFSAAIGIGRPFIMAGFKLQGCRSSGTLGISRHV